MFKKEKFCIILHCKTFAHLQDTQMEMFGEQMMTDRNQAFHGI